MAELFWLNGAPFEGIEPDDPKPNPPNYDTYWVDGVAANDLFEFVDGIPYTPPTPIYPTTEGFYGTEKFWFNGETYPGLESDDPKPNPPNYETYWEGGSADTEIFNFLDGIPYTPVTPIYPTTEGFYGTELYWQDGYTYEWLKAQASAQPNEELFWINGEAANAVFIMAKNTGSMFLVFEE